MADESLQTPDEAEDQLEPDTQIPVRLDSLEADGIRPEMGDQVTIKIDGTIKKIENDYAYVTTDAVNDTDINTIVNDTQQAGDEDEQMRKLTSNADALGTPMGSGGPFV